MLSRIRISKYLLGSSRLVTLPRYCSSDANKILLKENEIKGVPFVKKITNELEKHKGIQFVLPLHNDELMEKIVSPFDYLTNIGVQPEFLLDACLNDSSLIKAFVKNGDKVVKFLDAIVDMTEMTYENAIRLFAAYKDDILMESVENIQSRLQVFINARVSQGGELCKVVCKCPVILFSGDPQHMVKTVESLSNFFTRNQIKCILQNSPECLLRNFEELEEKYEYIYFIMRIEGDEFKMCKRWVDLPLDEIIKRHEFLLKCGRYVTPDPKRLQLQKENPPLYRILDTNPIIFATQVASVTHEEWVSYETLHEKLKEIEKKDRPFERVKPSMRKAYERKLKKSSPIEPYVLESS
uniref:mTERF domain-containing protein n=1 Tax=Strongyloides papillosus TaxID=174720 RepID=A0A0N5BAC5_STREA